MCTVSPFNILFAICRKQHLPELALSRRAASLASLQRRSDHVIIPVPDSMLALPAENINATSLSAVKVCKVCSC